MLIDLLTIYKKFLSSDSAEEKMHAFVNFIIEYWNAILDGLPYSDPEQSEVCTDFIRLGSDPH